MRQNNKKLMTTMLMGVSALLMLCSHRVCAEQLTVYKCSTTSQQLVLQDTPCKDQATLEILNIRINQSADTTVGLRRDEVVALKVMNQQLREQQILRALQNIAQNNPQAQLTLKLQN
jgi:hypothetical protein